MLSRHCAIEGSVTAVGAVSNRFYGTEGKGLRVSRSATEKSYVVYLSNLSFRRFSGRVLISHCFTSQCRQKRRV